MKPDSSRNKAENKSRDVAPDAPYDRRQASRAEAIIPGVGHGGVQHDFLVLLVGESGKAIRMAAVGQECQGERLVGAGAEVEAG